MKGTIRGLGSSVKIYKADTTDKIRTCIITSDQLWWLCSLTAEKWLNRDVMVGSVYMPHDSCHPKKRWPGSPKAGTSGWTICPGYPQGGHVDTLNHALTSTFRLPWPRCFRVFSFVRQMPKVPRKNGTRSALYRRRLNFFTISSSLTLNMTIRGSNPRKPSSQSYASA